jgi:hypothetical protein
MTIAGAPLGALALLSEIADVATRCKNSRAFVAAMRRKRDAAEAA